MILKLAVSLGVSADMLIFDDQEPEPREELKRQFEALGQFDYKGGQHRQGLAESLSLSLILKRNAKRAFSE